MKKNEFYEKLAESIKPAGFRSFLYNEEQSSLLFIITPANSWLCISEDYWGYGISYEYVPSKNFGSGVRWNEEPLCRDEIDTKALLKAEKYGKRYGKTQSYHGSRKGKGFYMPEHYPDAYKAMMSAWGEKLTEL